MNVLFQDDRMAHVAKIARWHACSSVESAFGYRLCGEFEDTCRVTAGAWYHGWEEYQVMGLGITDRPLEASWSRIQWKKFL